MKKPILSIVIIFFFLLGGFFWYVQRGYKEPILIPTGTNTTNTLNIPALEKELGIEIKEIPTPTSDIDISDWKTYRNEEYGFEFKYPGYYGNFPYINEEEDQVFLKTFSTGVEGVTTEALSISIDPNDTVDSWLKFVLNREGEHLDSIGYFTDSNGLQAIQIHQTYLNQDPPNEFSDYSYFFVKDSTVFLFNGSDGTPEDKKIQTSFSTFRFLK